MAMTSMARGVLMGGALIAALAVVLLALSGDDLEDEAALPGPPAGKSAFESARDAPAKADPTEEDASTRVNASDLVHPEEAQPHLDEGTASIGEPFVADANETSDGRTRREASGSTTQCPPGGVYTCSTRRVGNYVGSRLCGTTWKGQARVPCSASSPRLL